MSSSLLHILRFKDHASHLIRSVGGIGFVLLVVLVYRKVFLGEKKKEAKMEQAEEGNRTNEPSGSDRRNHIGLTLDREVMTLDPWYPNCPAGEHRGIRQNRTRWSNRTKAQWETDEQIERRRARMIIAERHLRRGILEFSHNLSNRRTCSHPGKEASVRRVEVGINNPEEQFGREAQGGGRSRRSEALHCKRCRRTYRATEAKPSKQTRTTIKDCGHLLFQHRDLGRHSAFGNTPGTRIRRKSRHGTFDQEGFSHCEQLNSRREDERSLRDKKRAGKHDSNNQLSRLKGKLNLDPKRGRSKVHPKRRNEPGQSGRSRGNRAAEGDAGRKGKRKERHQQRKKVAQGKGLAEDGEEDNRRQVGEKSRKPGSPAADAEERPEAAQSGEDTVTVDLLASHHSTANGQELLLPSAGVLPADLLQLPSGDTWPHPASQAEDGFMAAVNSAEFQPCLSPPPSFAFVEEAASGPGPAEILPLRGLGGSTQTGSAAEGLQQQEYLSEEPGSEPKRKLRLVLPEKTSSRPLTALERKIR